MLLNDVQFFMTGDVKTGENVGITGGYAVVEFFS
jgi:hypothetical protein